ncbi:PriA Primosomal protein N' (replication factor Y) - superfamily II helicase [Candidatus Nanopelagicaceae bacterium]
MQSVKPLRLKRETYRLGLKADTANVANVWVDSGLSHLDGIYTYRIPNDLLSSISIGSRIRVPFNNRSCEAIVVEINSSHAASGNLKVIESLLDFVPVASKCMIDFYAQMATYWASDPYSLIKSGIPPRVASSEKALLSQLNESPHLKSKASRKPDFTYLMHSPHVSAYTELVELAESRLKNGSVLLLVPDEKDVSNLFALLQNKKLSAPVFRLDSSLTRSERYSNYLQISMLQRLLVVGTRSALFVPINELDSIIVGFEKSEQFHEQKHPYWNVRDSAFIRSSIESCNVFFTGYVPSAEMAYQIEERKVKFVGNKNSLKTLAYPQEKGELLPDRVIPEIRKSLTQGKVLFLAPRKGYANLLLCAKCKNIALCDCGGRFLISSQNADPVCTICSLEIKNWKCAWCASTTRYAAARGIERFYEEIGRAFPNVPIQLSSAPNILEKISDQTKIVIATSGSVPATFEGYSSVVILEGQRFLSSGSATYEEMVYESFFNTAAHVRKNGNLVVVLDSYHPVIASLSRWNPSVLVKKILRENHDASLPPYTSTASLKVVLSEGVVLKNGISKSVKDGRLPISSKVYLTEDKSKNEARILISVPRDNRHVLANFLLELNRRRAATKKAYITFALDPYAL